MLGYLVSQAEKPAGLLNFIDKLARTPISQVVFFLSILTLARFVLYPYLSKTPLREQGRSYRFARGLNELFDAIIYAGIFVFLVIRPFIGQTFYIPTGSMLNTIQLGDYIVANKYSYRISEPKVGDIVVFWPPVWGFLGEDHSIPYIKRCVGTPGDTIEVKDGFLYRNGKKIVENYMLDSKMEYDFKLVEYNKEPWPVVIINGFANYSPYTTAPKYRIESHNYSQMQKLINSPLLKIPKDYFFMMGDNRNGSYDSHCWGLVPKNNIIAKSEFIWLPLNRIRLTR